ncbi:MAG: glycosyl hydrolase, partial [Robiginitalea sp.]|nr:glycosyl hydrolase [Robiginitalea sp.]
MKTIFTFLLGIGIAGIYAPVQAQQKPINESFYEGLEWRNIGPNRGGRSLGCAGSPSRPNEYYFGATGGGLWKTTDGGNEWKPVTDGQVTSSSVGAVAVAETNPDIVYIGMGEVQLRGSITQGDGVYKSTNAGKTWEHLGLEETQAVARIRIHPANPDVVYVAALGHPYGENEERGVFRTKDGGTTWEKVLYVSPKAGAVDLIIDRNNPEVLYASTWEVYRKAWKMWGGGGDSKLWKSTDGGDTWTDLTANPGMPAGPIGKIGV